MGNPWAGEVTLVIDGTPRRLKLTLGALAELEAGLGDDSLVALVERFEAGRFSARDLLALILAGLRGGGWQGRSEELAQAEIAGGPMGAARAAAELLARAFTVPGGADGPV
ncbi:gene transfer agent family protein [Pseudooceanicola nanhaiensis]|uniref:gene transfer agent family protein n=1 Tax=Pseudooceanicola nanhaiensis TaxID=375761 RepID=UPI001CD214F8|nr:gene transfer agent family protein [Pseudooceanicola nanhaiensis]MCA0922910.1 gene transfer agent family protein [Pseudooceanicola nanhaiensis]